MSLPLGHPNAYNTIPYPDFGQVAPPGSLSPRPTDLPVRAQMQPHASSLQQQQQQFPHPPQPYYPQQPQQAQPHAQQHQQHHQHPQFPQPQAQSPPASLGRGGAQLPLSSLGLNESEMAAFQRSAAIAVQNHHNIEVASQEHAASVSIFKAPVPLRTTATTTSPFGTFVTQM